MFAHGKPETVQLEFTRKGQESQISGRIYKHTINQLSVDFIAVSDRDGLIVCKYCSQNVPCVI